jgi:hypothetical protein
MKHLKLYEEFSETITLYHGTCLGNAEQLVKDGWKPYSGTMGSNMGQSSYLYVTSEKEDALWFAEEKGCSSIVEIKDIPIVFLKFDPEDGDADLYDYSITTAINKLKNGYDSPIKFVITHELSAEKFKIIQ